jgi:pyridoxal phosphate enzyme (YggS family)
VAVSKTKPTELLQAAYDAGVRDFGENYVQELVAKAPELPVDISWRFIGKVQSNKAKSLVHGVPSLSVVETVDTPKLANKLQAAVESMSPARASQLGVMVQVNTSPQEGTKGGVLAADAPALAAHIRDACPDLCLTGLMTIGAPGVRRAARHHLPQSIGTLEVRGPGTPLRCISHPLTFARAASSQETCRASTRSASAVTPSRPPSA